MQVALFSGVNAVVCRKRSFDNEKRKQLIARLTEICSFSLMAGIRIGLRNMSDVQKVEFARGLIRQMSGNPNFPAVDATLASLTAATRELETAYQEARVARQVAKTKTQVRKAASAALDTTVKQVARFVEIAAAGDPAKLTTSGFEVRSAKEPVGELTRPENLTVSVGETPGEVRLRWKHVRGASTYLIQRATDPDEAGSWMQIAVSTRARAILAGLTRGTRYWFRVCAVGAAGLGPWSNLVERFVP